MAVSATTTDPPLLPAATSLDVFIMINNYDLLVFTGRRPAVRVSIGCRLWYATSATSNPMPPVSRKASGPSI